jgi:hypothetical protein
VKFFCILFVIYFFYGVFFSRISQASAPRDQDLRSNNNYKSSLLELGTNYKAKLYCSCLYQMRLSKEYCKQFVSVQPEVFTLTTNPSSKVVESAALLFLYKARAKHTSEFFGCRLERTN